MDSSAPTANLEKLLRHYAERREEDIVFRIRYYREKAGECIVYRITHTEELRD